MIGRFLPGFKKDYRTGGARVTRMLHRTGILRCMFIEID
jgi:hypothetical protein